MSAETIRHFCALTGVAGHPDAAYLTYLGLYSLQHRGQEAAGIVSADGEQSYIHKALGLVNDVFKPEKLTELHGNLAIGHTRYSTTGSPILRNTQPIRVDYKGGTLSLAHNGNLTNTPELRSQMEEDGSIFQTTMDSEIFLHLVARSHRPTLEEKIEEAVSQVEGAYSLLFLSENTLIALRDPHGIRPLCLGEYEGAHIVASESCAFDIMGGKYLRDIEPGEMVVIRDGHLESRRFAENGLVTPCVFEFVYFSRPDSRIFGEKVDKVRRKLGKHLAREHPVDADIVISVPDSSNTATLGYAVESGIRFELGLIRNHYVGRTFIQPGQERRDHDVRVKFNPVEGVLRGRRVIVVDDSIVRGTTSMKLIRMIREAGAEEVHVRITCPPVAWPCFYGVDIPSRSELIAARMSAEEIGEHIGADTIGFLSLEGMLSAVEREGPMCHACYSGEYPIVPHSEISKESLEL
ncbi:amidophosphoribosyltransferase [Gemmatimonadota bacterium]